ncbi:GntR family transcriptional regulator [Anoxynatronum buryatiense]|uniref:Transcriptional regulator, GntR family n=1 Tax=Anoxynatronum buryatiense TaxID=489973 RepID=A0AA45WV73_9CLOT|nr:GntR family transcriptional regulator [Anoxynatronum buryatiense]SMP50743.1 transcriptional regulator, GntR family [Anoxynatronum buryatiense]
MEWKIEQPQNGHSVSDYVYEVLKKNIVALNVKPGDRISENEISELLQVSRTPVREAFIKLSKEDLLYILPQRGTYISYIDLDEVEEARFIRESLEKSVIELATSQFSEDALFLLEQNVASQKNKIAKKAYAEFLEVDEAFHKTIFQECNKMRTWSVIDQVNSQYKRIRVLSFIANINWEQTIEQHQGIIEAIRTKDTRKGLEIMSKHLKKLNIEKVELKRKYPEYFK